MMRDALVIIAASSPMERYRGKHDTTKHFAK